MKSNKQGSLICPTQIIEQIKERQKSVQRHKRVQKFCPNADNSDIYVNKQLIIQQPKSNTMQNNEKTIFQKIGGHDQLEKIVAQFYQYVLCDEKVCAFFLQNVSDIPKLHSTMVLFLTHLFGGENHYKGPNMIDLHKNMKIKMMHFDVTWDHMYAAFKYFNIDEAIIQDIKQRVYSLTGQIVTVKE